jgi:hypothetical protein
VFFEYAGQLWEADTDISRIIKRHAGEIHDIYEDVGECDVSDRELALMHASGQLCMWSIDEVLSSEQQYEDLMRWLVALEK